MSQRLERAASERRVRRRRQLPGSTTSTLASTSSSSTPTSSSSTSESSSTSTATSTLAASTSSSTSSSSSSVSTTSASSTGTRASAIPRPSAAPTSSVPRLKHVAQPSVEQPDSFSPTALSSSSSVVYGPIYTPLILASDPAPSSSSMPSDASNVTGNPSPSSSKRDKVGGLSMGIGILIGAIVLAAILIPAVFIHRYLRKRRRAKVWTRRRRLTHIDPGAHVGEHVEKIPVSPFVHGGPRPTSVMHISSAGLSDEFAQHVEFSPTRTHTPRTGTTPTSADLLLVPSQSPNSHSTASPGSQRGRPAALELGLARSGTTQTVRQSTPDGAVEFMIGLQPPSEPSATLSHDQPQTANTTEPSTSALSDEAPRRSSIEKRPARTLVAHNLSSPPFTPGQSPLPTPAPRYSQSHTTSLWSRLSGMRNSVIPPAYESPRPHQTTHLHVPPPSRATGSHLRDIEEPRDEEEAVAPRSWAPLRIARRREDAPQLPKPSFDGGGRI